MMLRTAERKEKGWLLFPEDYTYMTISSYTTSLGCPYTLRVHNISFSLTVSSPLIFSFGAPSLLVTL